MARRRGRLPFLACTSSAAAAAAAAPLLVDYRGVRRQQQSEHQRAAAVPCPRLNLEAQQLPAVTVQDLLAEGLLQYEPLQEPSLRSMRLCNKHTHAVLGKVVAAPAPSAAQQQQQTHGSSAQSLLQQATRDACSAAAAVDLLGCDDWPCALEAHVLEHGQHGQVGALLQRGDAARRPACARLGLMLIIMGLLEWLCSHAPPGRRSQLRGGRSAARHQQRRHQQRPDEAHPRRWRQPLCAPRCAQGGPEHTAVWVPCADDGGTFAPRARSCAWRRPDATRGACRRPTPLRQQEQLMCMAAQRIRTIRQGRHAGRQPPPSSTCRSCACRSSATTAAAETCRTAGRPAASWSSP